MVDVPFFDPRSEPPAESQEQVEQQWSPPSWDRPSEGTLPAVVGAGRLFARTENFALALDHLRVYPNGFQIVMAMVTSPRLPLALRMGGFSTMTLMSARVTTDGKPAVPLPPRPRPFADGPRIGVLFSNGQRAGARPDTGFEVPKDEAGIPTEPVMRPSGGGGGGGYFRWECWVFPLPSPGPLTIFAEWSTAGIEETSIVVSGDEIRDAARRAVVLWS
jgi:hypothetical protein